MSVVAAGSEARLRALRRSGELLEGAFETQPRWCEQIPGRIVHAHVMRHTALQHFDNMRNTRMFSWAYEEKAKTTASPEAVWNLWSNPDSWPTWDAGVAWAKLETTFSQGAYISMKPVKGPKVRCLLEEVTPLRSFTTRNDFPLAALSFTHRMEHGVVTHKVEIRGILTPLFKRLFGRDIRQGLPQTVRSLVGMAESTAVRPTK